MNKINFFFLLFVCTAFQAMAQYAEPEVRFYKNGTFFSWYQNQIDSIEFSDQDYDVYCQCEKPAPISYNNIKITVHAGKGFSIKRTKIGIAPADLDDNTLLTNALTGKLSLQDTTSFTYYVHEGAYKAIALGYDVNGNFRGHKISPTVEFTMESCLNEIVSNMTKSYFVYGFQSHETDMAYPSYMIAQTELLGDMYALSNSGYDWYRNYNTFQAVGKDTYFSYLPWSTFYKYVDSANDIIKYLKNEQLPNDKKTALGIAYAFRAFNYYTLMTFYEPKANIYTDCENVLGLTVPIVTESTTEEMAKNNPRASHDDMMQFILDDLKKAEELLKESDSSIKELPNLACVYGLMARAYMWDENFEKAAIYARKAIDTFGGSPMTESQWLDPLTAFNTPNQAWMWNLVHSAETMTNVANFTGWMSSEADWGYGRLTQYGIDKSLYDNIGENDFRRNAFIDPYRNRNSYSTVRDAEWLYDCPDYLSLKFRCVGGNYQTYNIGGNAVLPLMRIEEFYLLEAEAVGATQGVYAGKALLEQFMKNFRNPDYVCNASTQRDLQLEVLTQMRIEFWGEGEAFPQAKRIQPSVIQNYSQTNAPENIFRINCYGMKPNWNFVIPQQEINGNSAIEGHNNPDPSRVVIGPTPIGTFANGSYKADKNAQ